MKVASIQLHIRDVEHSPLFKQGPTFSAPYDPLVPYGQPQLRLLARHLHVISVIMVTREVGGCGHFSTGFVPPFLTVNPSSSTQ